MTNVTETPRRSAVVTGSSRGIGRAVAEELARAGFDVCVNCSSERGLAGARRVRRQLAAELGVRAIAVAANVADAAEAEALVAAAQEAFGRVDVLVNNAGITRDGLLARMKDEDFDAVIDVNLKGTFNCCKAAAQRMMKQRYGRIVNMSSVVGVAGNAGQANYAASKAGVIGLTKSLARELAAPQRHGQRRGAGLHRHRHDRRAVREAARGHRGPHRAKRLGEPEDVAAARALPGQRGGGLHHRTGCLHRRRYVAMSENSERGSTRRPDGTHRVVITGMGAVSPAGVGVEALWDAVMGRACCIGPVDALRHGRLRRAHRRRGARLRRGRARHHEEGGAPVRALRAVRHRRVRRGAGPVRALNLEAEDTARIACVFGTGIGGIDELQSGFFTLAEKGPKRVSPLFIPTMIGNIAAGNLSIRYGCAASA